MSAPLSSDRSVLEVSYRLIIANEHDSHVFFNTAGSRANKSAM